MIKLRKKLGYYWYNLKLQIALKRGKLVFDKNDLKNKLISQIGLCSKVLKYGQTLDGFTHTVIFLDYDSNNFFRVKDDVEYLQNKYQFGDTFFIETKKGFHVISPTIIPRKLFVRIVKESNCDKNLKPIVQWRKFLILRITPKPKRKQDLTAFAFYSYSTKYKYHKALYLFLAGFFSYLMSDIIRKSEVTENSFDNNFTNKLILEEYETRHY